MITKVKDAIFLFPEWYKEQLIHQTEQFAIANEISFDQIVLKKPESKSNNFSVEEAINLSLHQFFEKNNWTNENHSTKQYKGWTKEMSGSVLLNAFDHRNKKGATIDTFRKFIVFMDRQVKSVEQYLHEQSNLKQDMMYVVKDEIVQKGLAYDKHWLEKNMNFSFKEMKTPISSEVKSEEYRISVKSNEPEKAKEQTKIHATLPGIKGEKKSKRIQWRWLLLLLPILIYLYFQNIQSKHEPILQNEPKYSDTGELSNKVLRKSEDLLMAERQNSEEFRDHSLNTLEVKPPPQPYILANSAIKNDSRTQSIAFVLLNKQNQLDASMMAKVSYKIFSEQEVFFNLFKSTDLTTTNFKKLQLGNFENLNLNNCVDQLAIGTYNISCKTSKMSDRTISCIAEFNIHIFDTFDGSLIKSISKTQPGVGFDENTAIDNALDRIKFDS